MQPPNHPGKPDQTREVEVKLAVADCAGMDAALRQLGFAIVQPRAFESNAVYDTPGRALRAERKLLRVREFAGTATFTYKGTPEDGRHKSREELETEVADAATLRLMLERLGYQPCFHYEKYRTIYQRPGEAVGVVVLDETPIGNWIELEGAPEWIDATAAQLGYTQAEYSTESYGALWLRHCRDHGIDSPHMVFAQPPAV
jgi:adenylate cyclase class 2